MVNEPTHHVVHGHTKQSGNVSQRPLLVFSNANLNPNRKDRLWSRCLSPSCVVGGWHGTNHADGVPTRASSPRFVSNSR